MISGKETVRRFLEVSLFRTRERRDSVLEMHAKGYDTQAIVRELAKDFYPKWLTEFYPLQAFITNTAAQTELIIKEAEGN